MVAQIMTVAFQGIEAVPVRVQVMLSSGRMGMNIVGLADKTVAESRERIQAALHSFGLSMPVKKVTVNLAPADLPKEGSHYDLPIALGLLCAMQILPEEVEQRFVAIGELSLDGALSPVNGVLPAAMVAVGTGRGIICPEQNGPEAAFASLNLEVLAANHLLSLVNHFKGKNYLKRPEPLPIQNEKEALDLADIKGQAIAKRALEIAAAGRHNMLMIGPPGAGKSMLAQRLPSILPPLDAQETLEVSVIASMVGNGEKKFLSRRSPFRAPHHSSSMAALVGGGQKVRPGEVSLAHKGVLFLDEFPEFSPQVLDSLRQLLEMRSCTIARANYHITYPADIQLIAAMNPCKCGYAGQEGHQCSRGPRCRIDYQARISGPLLDRIDLYVEMPPVSASELMQNVAGEASLVVAQRVARARQRQKERFAKLGQAEITTNSSCPASLLEKVVVLEKEAHQLLCDMTKKFNLSARGYHRVLKVSRTIADLAKEEKVGRAHIAEAFSYRLVGAEKSGSFFS